MGFVMSQLPGERANILIVDDVPTNIETLIATLERDYDISIATSGAKALTLLAKGVAEGRLPDLILLDVMMPSMNGYEVCEALKRDSATRDIPVIFVTAKTDAESESLAFAGGAVDFIHKPINKDVVRARVDLHLSLLRQRVQLQQLNQQLAHSAHHDALTGLPNRVLFADRMQQSMLQTQRRGKQLAVAYLDLDGFKSINDRFGHEAGDTLLISLSQRMKEALRDGDTLARLGGDEFAALLVDLDNATGAEPVLQRLLEAAANSVTLFPGTTVQVSASIGVTVYPHDPADAEQLLRHADQSMYRAKQTGKNCYHTFNPVEDDAVRIRFEENEEIRRALKQEQFVLYYQPQVNMRTGVVMGVEALLRWDHPERGLISPGSFLPRIEDERLGIELNEWVIETVLRQMEAWHQQGLDISVAVNIGAYQLQQPDFAARLKRLLDAHPTIPPTSLELEVLEVSIFEDMGEVAETLDACRKMGLSIAIDDFGTACTSLICLQHLPADKLKIGQRCVLNMLDDVGNLNIVEAIVSLASAFGSRLVAEGVETVVHGEFLLVLGSEIAQGNAIAAPMPATSLKAWLAGWCPDAAWTMPSQKSRTRLAEIEIRAWATAVESYLAGHRSALPASEEHCCRLSGWHYPWSSVHPDEMTELDGLSPLYRKVHALGNELLILHTQGRQDEALGRLGELRYLSKELSVALGRFL